MLITAKRWRGRRRRVWPWRHVKFSRNHVFLQKLAASIDQLAAYIDARPSRWTILTSRAAVGAILAIVAIVVVRTRATVPTLPITCILTAGVKTNATIWDQRRRRRRDTQSRRVSGNNLKHHSRGQLRLLGVHVRHTNMLSIDEGAGGRFRGLLGKGNLQLVQECGLRRPGHVRMGRVLVCHMVVRIMMVMEEAKPVQLTRALADGRRQVVGSDPRLIVFQGRVRRLLHGGQVRVAKSRRRLLLPTYEVSSLIP